MYKDVRADWKIFIYFSGSSILLLIQWNTGQAGLSNKSKAKSQKSTSEVKVSSSSRGWKCGNGGSCWALFRVPSLGGWLWGVVGGAVGFRGGALFEYQLPLVCDQLSLTCEGWNVVNILLSQEKISRQCISSLGQTNCFFSCTFLTQSLNVATDLENWVDIVLPLEVKPDQGWRATSVREGGIHKHNIHFQILEKDDCRLFMFVCA